MTFVWCMALKASKMNRWLANAIGGLRVLFGWMGRIAFGYIVDRVLGYGDVLDVIGGVCSFRAQGEVCWGRGIDDS